MIKKKNLTEEDKKIWEDYLKDPSNIFDKEVSLNNHKKRKVRFKYDLHGLSLDEANKKVKEIISYCKKNNYKELLIITGKGIHSTNDRDVYVSKDLGKLKYSVPEFIKTHEDLNDCVISIREADNKDGGKGALLIKLKNLQNKF